MRIKALISGVVLFPGELEKWYTHSSDFTYIESNEAIEICFNRFNAELIKETPGLFQCNCGSFSIHNNSNYPVRIQGIKFSCSINIRKNVIITDFDKTPFISLFKENACVEVCCSDIMKIIEGIKKPQHPDSRDRIDSRLIRLNRYIRKNYNSSLSLQDLADYVGVHPTYLSNTYSKVFKISPILFINQLRMEAAKELLVQHNLTIKHIAEIVGYNSTSQFSLIFKRFNSKTPSQYRVEALSTF
jgi:AraC-like DNA-binding protein